MEFYLHLPISWSSEVTMLAKPKSDSLTPKLSSNKMFSGWRIMETESLDYLGEPL